VAWFVIRHPGLDVTAGALLLVWINTGWPGLAALTGAVLAVLLVLRLARPDWFARLVTRPVRDRWRWWCYRRRWQAVMTIARLAPLYQGRVLLPVLGRVNSSRFTDRVNVGLVSGQSPKDFADRSEGIAHGLRVRQCRVRAGQPGMITLELVRRDALAEPIPALPISPEVNLRALPVGRCEDGSLFALRLHGTHLLIAGATGAGKGSYLWGLVRAMLPAMAAGLVRVHAADPKLMELAFGRPLFDRHGRYAADPGDIAELLETDVADMQDRAALFAGKQRDHIPTAECPFVVVVVDEIAFLTAYQADRKLKERTLAALATLTTQGRAVGYCVVAALQDPRKEVLNIRNLFPDKIALRLDEPSQADMVLGDGARDRGACCDEISSDPVQGAGVGFFRLEADPDPVRVRAAYVSDDDIRAMNLSYAPGPATPATTAGAE
jgi:S-DNA-T family DNA segregation ATPase FtsK/SpoIIIE